jgi:hypothetical protein
MSLMIAKRKDVIKALIEGDLAEAANKIKEWDGERVIVKTGEKATLFMESPKIFNHEKTRTVILRDIEDQ